MNIFKILPAAGLGRSLGKRKDRHRKRGRQCWPRWLSKKWLAPLFRGVHSSLAPTARPGSYARKPLLRKAFCGFDAHPPGGLLLSLRDNSPCAAKSDVRPALPAAEEARRTPSGQGRCRKPLSRRRATAIGHCIAAPAPPGGAASGTVPALPAPFSIIPTGIWSAIPRARPPAGRIPLRRSGGIWLPPPAAHKTTG